MDGSGAYGRALPSFKVAALVAALGGVVVGVVLSSGALIAQGYLRQRLGAHEARLAQALSASLGAEAAANVRPSGKNRPWRRRSPSTPPTREAGRTRREDGCSDDQTGCESVADASAAGLHAAHFTAAYVRDRHILHEEMEATGYLRWNHSSLSELHQIYNTTRLTDSQEWLVIPEDGLYFVYSQVTWWGREATELHQVTNTDSLQNSIVMKVQDRRGLIELVTSMTTQSRDRCNGDCPLDSSYVSGIFHLDELAQIAVMASTKAAICTHADKTFVGVFMIRQELEE